MKGGLFDNHSHSYFSADSRMDIVDAVKTAYERGLGGLCLTDHLDFDPPAGVADFTFDVPSQQTAIDEDVEFLGLNGRGGKYGDPAAQGGGDRSAGQEYADYTENPSRQQV